MQREWRLFLAKIFSGVHTEADCELTHCPDALSWLRTESGPSGSFWMPGGLSSEVLGDGCRGCAIGVWCTSATVGRMCGR